MNENENKILNYKNFASQGNNWDNKSVGENDINFNHQWMELEENEKKTLVRSNSAASLLKNFSSLPTDAQIIVWNNCVSSFNFEKFGDKLTLADISAENISGELMKFKSKIIHSVLRQNGYYIDKEKLENVPADDSFFIRVIDDCIDFSSRENSYNDQGNKITTLIEELSKWMKGKKLAIDYINHLLFCYYNDICQYIASENLELDKPLLSLDNLKKIILYIDFNQNENTDWDCNGIYYFFNLVCDSLIGMKQDNQYIKVYIANLLSYFGYKTEGIENVENQPESLSKLPTAKKFYENAEKSEEGLRLLKCIKALGFTLVLAENKIFKLEQVDEVDKLIAGIECCNSTELNNWILSINTKDEKDRNQNAGDENANNNYLEITSFDDFKNMKKNAIVSFIKNSENKIKLKEKYKILLKQDNQDKLDEIILNKDVVDWMLQNLTIDVFEGKDVQDVADIVKKFYEYTNKPNEKISSTNLMLLLTSFQDGSLTNDNVNPILEINGKNDGYELGDGTKKMDLSYLLYILRSLNKKQGIPEKLITLIMQTIDFKLTDLNNCMDRYHFYGALFFLIRCSKKYNEDNPKEAIKDVFNNQNQILNELLKIQNAKDYLSVGVMQKEKNFGSKLAYLFVKSGLKISFEAQSKDKINEINENEINKNDDNTIEDNNELSEGNGDKDDLKFELKEMDKVEKLIIELSQENDLNNWVKGVNTTDERRRNQNAEDENAKGNYLEIKSFDDFKNMKKNSIVSFIENSKNANELKNKYQILLEKNNQDKLDEIILNKDVVDWMLESLNTDVFEGKDVQNVADIVRKFYQYTNQLNAKISSTNLIVLLTSFKEKSLTNNDVNLILEINGKNDGSKLEDGTGKKPIGYLLYVLRALSLDDKQGIPENLITLIMQTIDFKLANLKNDVIREYFYGALFFLIRCSKQYNETSPKKAIEDVFSAENKILNELLKIQNAKDYLNVGVMQKEKNFGSKLANLFVNSGLKISFEDQLDEIKENKINENDNNIVENANKSGKENNYENNLKFKLKEMDAVEKLIIELSQENDLNKWVKGVNTINEESRNENAGKDNYLEITSFDAFKNMKKNSIVSFIEQRKNANELNKKYKILLDEKNKNRLDEVVLDINTVNWILQFVPKGILGQYDFDAVTEVVKKFYQYTDKPSDKASPWATINLLMAFKQGSLKTSQMSKLLEINNWNATLGSNDLNCDLDKVWSILLVLGNEEKIPEELLDLIEQTFDFSQVQLDDNGQQECFYCIVEHFMKNSTDDKSDKPNDISIFAQNILDKINDNDENSDVYTKFLIKIISQNLSYKSYLEFLASDTEGNKTFDIPVLDKYNEYNDENFEEGEGEGEEAIEGAIEEEDDDDYDENNMTEFTQLAIDNKQEIILKGNTKIEEKPEKANNDAMEIVQGEQFITLASAKNKNRENKNYEIEKNINFMYELKKNPEKEIAVINDSEMNELKRENGELQKENKALRKENETLKNKEKESIENLEQMQNENKKLLTNINENQKAMEVLNNRIKELEMQNEKLISEIKQLTVDKGKEKDMNNQIKILENEKNNLSNQNEQLKNELEQLAKISEYKNNQVQEISNVNPKLQSKPNKKLKYTLYIFALIIAVASVAIGFYMSLYAFLGLIVSLILLFVVSYLNSKSQEGNNFKLINNNIPSMTDRDLLNKSKDIIRDGTQYPISKTNKYKEKNTEGKDDN